MKTFNVLLRGTAFFIHVFVCWNIPFFTDCGTHLAHCTHWSTEHCIFHTLLHILQCTTSLSFQYTLCTAHHTAHCITHCTLNYKLYTVPIAWHFTLYTALYTAILNPHCTTHFTVPYTLQIALHTAHFWLPCRGQLGNALGSPVSVLPRTGDTTLHYIIYTVVYCNGT